jgi:hypothetical protein
MKYFEDPISMDELKHYIGKKCIIQVKETNLIDREIRNGILMEVENGTIKWVEENGKIDSIFSHNVRSIEIEE